jgi:hypothetical protein
VEAEYLTVKAAADRYGVSQWCIRQDFYAGKLRAKRYGQRVLIEGASLKEHFANLPDALSTRAFPGQRHGSLRRHHPPTDREVTGDAGQR